MGTKVGCGRVKAQDGKRQGIAWHPKAMNSSQKAILDLELIKTGFRDNTKNKYLTCLKHNISNSELVDQ